MTSLKAIEAAVHLLCNVVEASKKYQQADDTDIQRAKHALLTLIEGVCKDSERLDWFFGKQDKMPFMNTYLEGMRAGWTPNQWRAAIDAALAATDEVQK